MDCVNEHLSQYNMNCENCDLEKAPGNSDSQPGLRQEIKAFLRIILLVATKPGARKWHLHFDVDVNYKF